MNLTELSNYCISLLLDDPSCASATSSTITLTPLENVQRHLGDSAVVDNHPPIGRSAMYLCNSYFVGYARCQIIGSWGCYWHYLGQMCTERWRLGIDRIYRLRLQASTLVKDVQRNLIESRGTSSLSLNWSLVFNLHGVFGASVFVSGMNLEPTVLGWLLWGHHWLPWWTPNLFRFGIFAVLAAYKCPKYGEFSLTFVQIHSL